ncbi:MAG: hypothetical protein WKF35_03765 [Ferruginibacter sp.]
MKRIFLLIVCITLGFYLKAQSIDEINKMVNANNFKGAKAYIDTYLGDPKNGSKAEGWYYKGRIYNGLSYDSSVTMTDKAIYKAAAYDAFKKNQQLDPLDLRMKVESYRSYLDLYYGYYDLGAGFFNVKKYEEAYNSFSKALEVKDYILSKNYTYTDAKIYPLDTALILNAAISASQAKKEDLALKHYQKLVDGNVAGKGYEEVYEYLVTYYNDKDDQANLQSILTKAKMHYPANDYWTELEVKAVGKKGDQAALFAKYEEILAKNPESFTHSYNYAIELYNNMYGKDAKPSTDADKAKLTSIIKIAIQNDKNNDAVMLMSNHLFNAASDMSIAASLLKGTKPEDVKKKKDLNAASMKYMNEFIPYGELAIKYFDSQTELKPIQKANNRIVLGYMSDVYNAKKDLKKAAEYDKKKLKSN